MGHMIELIWACPDPRCREEDSQSGLVGTVIPGRNELGASLSSEYSVPIVLKITIKSKRVFSKNLSWSCPKTFEFMVKFLGTWKIIIA